MFAKIVFVCMSRVQCQSQCLLLVNQCFDKFANELEAHKKQTFDTPEDQLSHLCNPISGLFTQFVECVANTESQCSQENNYRNHLCESRKLKTKITRFTWKATFFYQLCHNTIPQMSQDLIQYEDCISSVLNARKWKCDINYDKPIKSMRDWKNNLNTTCSLWRKFRDCSKYDVKAKCGAQAMLIADHLFHSHQSYFEKYQTCGLEGSAPDQCWYDALKGPVTTTTTSATETTANNIGVTDESPELITVNDDQTQTQTAQTVQTSETLPNEESLSHDDRQSINGSDEHSTDNQPRDLVAQKDTTTTSATVVSHKQTSDQNLEHLISSAATLHDQCGAGYLLLIPVLLLLFVKFIAN